MSDPTLRLRPKDGVLIEVRQFTIAEICRLIAIPPAMLLPVASREVSK